MYLPREIVVIIAEFLGQIFGERYRPAKGLKKLGKNRLWRDPYLLDYMVEKSGVKSVPLRDIIKYSEFRPGLAKYFEERRIAAITHGELCVFPLFYGKERVKEYLANYLHVSKAYIMEVVRNLPIQYVPLLEEMVSEPYVRKLNRDEISLIWRSLSRHSDNFALLKTRPALISSLNLRENKSPGAMQFYMEIYDDDDFLPFQMHPYNTQYFLENVHIIHDKLFQHNPHPDVVKFYLDRLERINCLFATNKNVTAIEYMVKNIDKFTFLSQKKIKENLSENPEALPYLFKNPDWINERYALLNPKFGAIYEKFPGIFNMKTVKRNLRYANVRDIERELRETTEFLSKEIFC